MNLPDSFIFVLDVHFPADRSPWPDNGLRKAVPVPGLPQWTVQPHQAPAGWTHFTVHSPELKGEDGLTGLLVLLDFLAEAGPADVGLSSLAVRVCPETNSGFQLETVSRVFDAYQPVLNALHGELIQEKGVSYRHDFSQLTLAGLPVTSSEPATFGAALLALALLEYGLTVEEPNLPLPATQKHQMLVHLVNELDITQEVRDEIIPAIKNRVLVAGMMLGELSLRRAKQLSGQVDL